MLGLVAVGSLSQLCRAERAAMLSEAIADGCDADLRGERRLRALFSLVVAIVSVTSTARVTPPGSELVTMANAKRPSTVKAMLAL